MFTKLAVFLGIILILDLFLSWLDYRYLKNKYLKSEHFDLNVCCGNTVCQGINADIVKRKVPRFVLIKDIYRLPFKNKQFKNAICFHVLEHVSDPVMFFNELKRVAENITILVPPLWDPGCMLTINEHKWQFLTFKTKYRNKLPKFFKIPLAETYQKIFGQTIRPKI